MRHRHALTLAGLCFLLPAMAWGQKRVMPTAADAGLPPYIQLDTADQTMTATFHSPYGIDAASVKFTVDGVDRTRDAKHDDKTLSYHVPEQHIMSGYSVRLELKDKRGQRGVAAVSPTTFIDDAGTVVSYFLPRREMTRVHVCLYGNETSQRTFTGWHGPGEVAVPWNGKDDAGSRVDVGVYMFYVEALRGKHWVRIAAIDPVDDTERLKREAALAYYAVPAQAVRKRGGRDEFLFFTLNPKLIKRETGEFEGATYGGQSGCLVFASRDVRGQFAILWQYDLPDDGEDAVWWDNAAGQTKDAIAVQLMSGAFMTFHAPDGEPPTLLNGPRYIPGETFGAPLRKGFWVRPDSSQPAFVLDDEYSVTLVNLAAGTAQALWSTPTVKEPNGVIDEEGFPHLLAVGDLTGDGGLEIVAHTERDQIISGDVLRLDSSLRVWRYADGKFQEVYSVPLPGFRATAGTALFRSPGNPPWIAVNLLPTGGKGDAVLAAFRWNGTTLAEVPAMRKMGLNLQWNGPGKAMMAAADLDGDGTDGLLLIIDARRTTRLVVLKYVGDTLRPTWQSPPLSREVHFGRVQASEAGGQQEVELLQGYDSPPYGGTVSLFRQAGNKFTGWEAQHYVPPPPPPPKPPPPPPPTAEERLSSLTYDEGYGFRDPFLTLDGKKIIQLHSTNDMINASWREKQDRKRLLLLAKQRFPANRVVLRQRGSLWKVMAGSMAVEILMPEDAKNAKRPLSALAQDWLTAVQAILRGLETTPPLKR